MRLNHSLATIGLLAYSTITLLKTGQRISFMLLFGFDKLTTTNAMLLFLTPTLSYQFRQRVFQTLSHRVNALVNLHTE
jgi:hypothetical protein